MKGKRFKFNVSVCNFFLPIRKDAVCRVPENDGDYYYYYDDDDEEDNCNNDDYKELTFTIFDNHNIIVCGSLKTRLVFLHSFDI